MKDIKPLYIDDDGYIYDVKSVKSNNPIIIGSFKKWKN